MIDDTMASITEASDKSWYKINEIPIVKFVECMKALYATLEGKQKHYSADDPFYKQVFMAFFKMPPEEWEHTRRIIQVERAFTMELGNLHQALMGSFPHTENYKTGHSSGCDIGHVDGSWVAEVKNNVNTMNSSSKESVLRKLQLQHTLGKRAILVIINGNTRHEIKNEVEYISGREFYNELSGRVNFMDDLLKTLVDCVSKYDTYDALMRCLETP